jgi:hypothetical protein
VRSSDVVDGKGLGTGLGKGLLIPRSDSILWRKADAAPLPRRSKTALEGECVVFGPMVGEGCGEAKLVWSNGDVVAVTKSGSGPNRLLSKVSGGGIVRVACLAVGEGEAGAVSDADNEGSESGTDAEDSEFCEWWTGGVGSVGMGGGTIATV